MTSRNLVPGLILIALGGYLAVVQLTGIGGEAIVALIGGVFLVAYLATRTYGFLVPGGILTGLGLGIVWETRVVDGGGPVLIGLGAGFLSVYLIDLLVARRDARWWPIIPGSILAVIGVLVQSGQEQLLDESSGLWPLALILIGALLLVAQMRPRRAPDREEGSQPVAQ